MNCLTCNKPVTKEQEGKIPLCSTLCRSKHYHKKKRRILIDMCIKLNDLEGIRGLTIGTIYAMGYQIQIKPSEEKLFLNEVEQYLSTPASTL